MGRRDWAAEERGLRWRVEASLYIPHGVGSRVPYLIVVAVHGGLINAALSGTGTVTLSVGAGGVERNTRYEKCRRNSAFAARFRASRGWLKREFLTEGAHPPRPPPVPKYLLSCPKTAT